LPNKINSTQLNSTGFVVRNCCSLQLYKDPNDLYQGLLQREKALQPLARDVTRVERTACGQLKPN